MDDLLSSARSIRDAHMWVELAAAADSCWNDAVRETCYRQAITLAPSWSLPYSLLGIALQRQGRYEEGLASASHAVRLAPWDAMTVYHLGVMLANEGDLVSAVDLLNEALTLNPDIPELHRDLGHVLLLNGDLRRGFREYAWRLKVAGYLQGYPWPSPAIPQWDGSDLHGKTIVLHGEPIHGFGDHLMLVRYAEQVAAMGGRVMVATPFKLRRLVATVRGVDQVVGTGRRARWPAHDVAAPMMSLPYLLGTTPANIPPPARFTIGPSVPRLTKTDRLKVGVCWGIHMRHNRNGSLPAYARSCPLPHFQPLFELSGIDWVSLQVGPSAWDLQRAGLADRVLDLNQHVTDFYDSAALVQQLDLVISIDTAQAHLSASLGVPTWILLPTMCDWRWQTGREDSPWYPGTVRLFRQQQPGNWAGVVEQVQEALRMFCASSS